jgi:hypothetical protein
VLSILRSVSGMPAANGCHAVDDRRSRVGLAETRRCSGSAGPVPRTACDGPRWPENNDARVYRSQLEVRHRGCDAHNPAHHHRYLAADRRRIWLQPSRATQRVGKAADYPVGRPQCDGSGMAARLGTFVPSRPPRRFRQGHKSSGRQLLHTSVTRFLPSEGFHGSRAT